MKHFFCAAALLVLSVNLFAQSTGTASYATWKNNAKGAYTIVHDDFGSAIVGGIENYADTIAYNRSVKFSFGAITSMCDAADWVNANTLIAHGHEIINHSHSHYCAWDSPDCGSGGLFYGPSDFPVELDGSTQLIASNTGKQPLFFIHPYDLHTEEEIDHLKTLGYVGTRGGIKNILNAKDFNDPYHVNFFVYAPGMPFSSLNEAVDKAINAGGWAMRELHGVEDASWGSIPLADYRNHIDYVKSKMDLNEIWNATASEVVTYKMQKDAFAISTVYNATTGDIQVNFAQLSAIDISVLQTPVTVNINVGSVNYQLFQNGEEITDFIKTADRITVNVYPHKGNLQLVNTSGTTPPVLSFITPAQDTTYADPATLHVICNATDADGTISMVELLYNNVVVATATNAPYTFTWNAPGPGIYSLTARATDNSNTTGSATINIAVSSPCGYEPWNSTSIYLHGRRVVYNHKAYEAQWWTQNEAPPGTSGVWIYVGECGVPNNAPPVVSIISPANNASYKEPADVIIAVDATDADGTVDKVELFYNDAVVATATAAPFTFNWTAPATGTIELVVKATDNGGANSSTAVTIQVNSACGYAPWNSNSIYLHGDRVVYNNKAYEAQWWTQNEAPPGTSGVWTFAGNCDVPANLSPVVTMEHPSDNAEYVLPGVVNIDYTATDNDGSIATVELFINGVYTATSTTNNFDWVPSAAGAYILSVKATDDGGAVGFTSLAINVRSTCGYNAWDANTIYLHGDRVIYNGNGYEAQWWTQNEAPPGTSGVWLALGGCAVPNMEPSVGITSPVNNAAFTAPATVSISADATDTDGSIYKVEFFNGSTKIGTAINAPYTIGWTNVTGGTYTITAVATDNNGAAITSSPVVITVNNIVANIPPVVLITAPANNAVFTTGATIPITADATDADGTIARVKFFVNGVMVHTDKTAPYTYNMLNAAKGKYKIRARAFDNTGASTLSAVVKITVTDAVQAIAAVNAADNISAGKITLYPNPAKDIIHINTGFDGNKKVNLLIYNAAGKLCKQITAYSVKNQYTSIDISGLVPGVYMLHVADDKGVNVQSIKFIKQR